MGVALLRVHIPEGTVFYTPPGWLVALAVGNSPTGGSAASDTFCAGFKKPILTKGVDLSALKSVLELKQKEGEAASIAAVTNIIQAVQGSTIG
eukprot:1739676-Alexandrium_andersonii.AAC.1